MLAVKKAKPAIHLYNDDTVKWEHDGKKYCLHVQQDDMPDSPREWDNITVMACWHRSYRLGDKLEDKDQEDFWLRLVRENVPENEIYAMAEAGKLTGIRIAKNEKDPELVDVYETSYWDTIIGDGDPAECLELTYEAVNSATAIYYLMDDLTIGQCMTLMEPYAEWMPLWLYDHSGISMSCGARTGQFADRWDSGQVGWIIALKKTIMAEVGSEYVLDENGEQIRVEHKHEGSPSTWSYLTRPLTDETWRNRAIEIMKANVETYDQYLTNDVYGYKLYEAEDPDDPEWDEIESCWSFYGSDVLESGLADEVGYGLKEALLSGKYEAGEAELHTSSYYTF